MESFEKFSSIPLIESGLNTSRMIYNRVKSTNRLFGWGLETSENVANSMLESVRPAVKFIEGPLEAIDKIGMKVLERVEGKMNIVFSKANRLKFLSNFEETLPNLYLPPQMMYWNTKEYVSDRVVRPVLKRADSFGDIVDGAITKADYALDKYLPDKVPVKNAFDSENNEELKKKNHAFQTYRRSQRFSKKLKNKLASRTVAEVNALKNDVNILMYAAELIVTNPKKAYQRSQEMWQYFSANEPENQKRPETMEQLFVLLVRYVEPWTKI